ncbi:unnamed protein product [Ostreobium quekettii]|uniref:Uncharacterized protein n=1 Tax=Ostreobium quekettii TaxID=121088 RepID=A0A8S1IN81_9CHLO|nr:unnamed protein product [Ostreobium quekettii]
MPHRSGDKTPWVTSGDGHGHASGMEVWGMCAISMDVLGIVPSLSGAGIPCKGSGSGLVQVDSLVIYSGTVGLQSPHVMIVSFFHARHGCGTSSLFRSNFVVPSLFPNTG